MHESLPFDVMCEIFTHYQRGEDDFHPLETLLLVCKAWASAALSYRALWGRYKIRLGHEPTFKMWRTRLPLRLVRSGDSHIEIDISTEMDGDNDPHRNVQFYAKECLGDDAHGRSFWLCRCSSKHESLVSWIFDLLTGPNGRGCERWRELRFYADIYFMDFGPLSASRSLFRALTYPMPSLVSLFLYRISVSCLPSHDLPLVPCAPMLRNTTFGDCCLPHQLNWLKNARRIEISNARHWSTHLIDLSGVEKVEQLILDNVDVTFPVELPYLSHLTLTGWRSMAFGPGSMPRLTSLSLNSGDCRLWRKLTQFRSLPFEQLKHLEIRSRSEPHPSCNELKDSIFPVILSCNNLSSIAASRTFFGVLLELLLQNRDVPKRSEKEGQIQVNPRHSKERLKLLSLSGGLIGELSGEENQAQLLSLASRWGLPCSSD